VTLNGPPPQELPGWLPIAPAGWGETTEADIILE
jgi:hypothetical protein